MLQSHNPATAAPKQAREELQRSVDYLETRPDITKDKIGFLGRSWGGAKGTIMVATESRLKLAIFLVGGFYFQKAYPEVEAINFAPRVKVPSLMLNGRHDFFLPPDTSQVYMYRLIGVPEPHKRWVVYDTGHGLPVRLKACVIGEVEVLFRYTLSGL